MSPIEKDPSVGINAAVAAELRAERGAQKITVEALAQRSGVPKRTLLRLLNAERGIAMEPLTAIAGALNVPVSLVVSRAEERLEREVAADVDQEHPAFDKPMSGPAPEGSAGASAPAVPIGSGRRVVSLPPGVAEEAAAQHVDDDVEAEMWEREDTP